MGRINLTNTRYEILFVHIPFAFVFEHPVWTKGDYCRKKGTVTYVSSQNVYVKFSGMEHINKGDTLFSKKGEQLLPSL